jgi:hypothetical protein
LKLVLAYWPSQWQAATSNETVIDLIFGVFSSEEIARRTIRESMSGDEWEEFRSQFVYEELNLDDYHPIPHLV